MARRVSRAPGRSSSRPRRSLATARGSPARTGFASSTGSPQVLEDLARDDHLLDLVGPLADLACLDVAPVALHGELPGVAATAVDLHGGVAGPGGGPGRVVLGDRRLHGGRAAGVLRAGGAPDQQPGGVELG